VAHERHAGLVRLPIGNLYLVNFGRQGYDRDQFAIGPAASGIFTRFLVHMPASFDRQVARWPLLSLGTDR